MNDLEIFSDKEKYMLQFDCGEKIKEELIKYGYLRKKVNKPKKNKKINLYLCKANEEGRFCGFSKCTWEAGAFFSSAPRSQFSLETLAQEQYRDNIKAGSIKFYF